MLCNSHGNEANLYSYAFQFLLLALQHLKSLKWTCSCDPEGEACQDYKCRMRSRIRRTCHGHLRWLYKNALQNGLTSHYWASGEVMKSQKIHLTKKSIMDIPFHIIKAADFYHIIADEYIPEDFVKEYKDIFHCWISLLHLDNKNNEYVFPRSKDTTTHEFFFAEQAIIWRALKSGEKFGIESSEIPNGKNKTNYSAVDIQNSVLRKFGCESSIPDKPMMAISRSVYGNTFELEFQDTAIFHALDHGIFTTDEDSRMGQRKMELWINTLDHQMESGGRINSFWSDSSQAALAVILSAKSRRTKSDSMKRRHESAKSALLRSSSPNGLLAGHLGEDQESILPKDSYHSYWHAAFEIPYILWMYGVESPNADGALSEHASSGEAILHLAPMEPTPTRGSFSSSSQFYNGRSLSTNHTNKGKVVEYPDEWLYTKPRFLTFEVDLRDQTAKEFYDQNKYKDLGNVINRAFQLMQQLSTTSLDPDSMKGYIVDVPEFAGSKKLENFPPNYIQQATNLRLQIDPRVGSKFEKYNDDPVQEDPLPTPAKKRLMHFHEMNFELARACYQASSEAENLSRFLDRHATYDKYFDEDARLIFNSWTTELQLSFYQILSGDLTVPGDVISNPKIIPFPGFGKGRKSQSISRVSMSLRFDGDIFDSHWVSHFIEFNPKQIQWKTKGQSTIVQQTTVQPFTEMNISYAAEKNLWQERRILELLMFEKMLYEMLQSSRGVLQQIKRSIWESSKNRVKKSSLDQYETDYELAMLLAEFDIFENISAEAIQSMRSTWYKFQRIVDIVEEDLKENLDTINLWINREGIRRDKPQWPESSERKYGWIISRLSLANDRKYDELKRCYDSVKTLNTSLTKKMETAREEWELQSNNDIRLFTYVTVVFLPIGFATSIFSMSGAPSGNTLINMIIVAAAAFGVTIIALFNAKALDFKIVRPILRICRYILEPCFYICWYILRGLFSLLHVTVLSCVSSFYHIMVLPCVYLAARYIYYPAFPPEKSLNKTSITQEESATDLISLANFAEKACILFHKFDNPISLARKNFEKAKSQREETKERASMA